jgi:hypothetical protein
MILAKTYDIIRDYNRKIQILNNDPSSPDYEKRANAIKEDTEKRLFDILKTNEFDRHSNKQ